MKRRNFLNLAATTVVIAGVPYYLLSDKTNFVRADNMPRETIKIPLKPVEKEILTPSPGL